MHRSLKAGKQLPHFHQTLHELVVLCSKIKSPTPLKQHDDFGFMALSFFCGQTQNAEAVLILTAKSQHNAAGLIARCMVEGLVQLGWAANDKMVRAQRWRNFALVSDWREINKKIEAGEKVAPAKQAKIESALRSFGHTFHTDKAKKCARGGKPLPPDPYCKNWTGYTYSEVFQCIGASVLKKAVWSPLSARQHWDPGAVGQSIRRNNSNITFLPPSDNAGVQALTLGFLCLYQTVDILDKHFVLGIGPELKQLKEKHLGKGS